MKSKSYLWLYYICFILTFLVMGVSSINVVPAFNLTFDDTNSAFSIFSNFIEYISMNNGLLIFSICSLIMVVIFTIMLFKKRILNVNSTAFPISYIVFLIIMMGICFLFNNKVIMPYIHFGYYQRFILIDYLFLNIYSLLCLTKNKD